MCEHSNDVGRAAFAAGEFDAAVMHFTNAIELCEADSGSLALTVKFLGNRAAAQFRLRNYCECE